MASCCAPACSLALPVKPQGVWARGSEAWAGSRDLRNLEFVRWGASGPSSLMIFTSLHEQGWGQIRFIQYKYKYIFFQSFKYKYKYKYTGKNLIKYNYKYKYSSSNTNTNTNTQWGRDKIAAILQMTYSNSLHCKKIVLFIQISLKIVSKGPIYRNKLALVQIVAWCWVGNKP